MLTTIELWFSTPRHSAVHRPIQPQSVSPLVPTWLLANCYCCQCEKEKEASITMSEHIRVFHIWDFDQAPPTDKRGPTKVLVQAVPIWCLGQCQECVHTTQSPVSLTTSVSTWQWPCYLARRPPLAYGAERYSSSRGTSHMTHCFGGKVLNVELSLLWTMYDPMLPFNAGRST